MIHELLDEEPVITEAFFRRASDGALMRRTGQNTVPATPAGFDVITEAQYAVYLTDAEADQAAAEQAVAVAEALSAQADYAALVAAGIPAATASRLSGHTP